MDLDPVSQLSQLPVRHYEYLQKLEDLIAEILYDLDGHEG
jgi:hypothetical protein